MSAHVLLNLLNELGKKIRCEPLPSISVFPNEFNKFNNTGARMQASIYLLTVRDKVKCELQVASCESRVGS